MEIITKHWETFNIVRHGDETLEKGITKNHTRKTIERHISLGNADSIACSVETATEYRSLFGLFSPKMLFYYYFFV
jgi:hypothetical protein